MTKRSAPDSSAILMNFSAVLRNARERRLPPPAYNFLHAFGDEQLFFDGFFVKFLYELGRRLRQRRCDLLVHFARRFRKREWIPSKFSTAKPPSFPIAIANFASTTPSMALAKNGISSFSDPICVEICTSSGLQVTALPALTQFHRNHRHGAPRASRAQQRRYDMFNPLLDFWRGSKWSDADISPVYPRKRSDKPHPTPKTKSERCLRPRKFSRAARCCSK